MFQRQGFQIAYIGKKRVSKADYRKQFRTVVSPQNNNYFRKVRSSVALDFFLLLLLPLVVRLVSKQDLKSSDMA